MPVERPMSFRQVRFKLEALGFSGISQKGNHAKFIRQDKSGTLTAILPHYQELTPAVIESIIRQSGLSKDAFDRA